MNDYDILTGYLREFRVVHLFNKNQTDVFSTDLIAEFERNKHRFLDENNDIRKDCGYLIDSKNSPENLKQTQIINKQVQLLNKQKDQILIYSCAVSSVLQLIEKEKEKDPSHSNYLVDLIENKLNECGRQVLKILIGGNNE